MKEETYLCSYDFEDREYGFEVIASSWEEAQRRVQAMGHGRVDGILKVSFGIPTPKGLFIWLRRFW